MRRRWAVVSWWLSVAVPTGAAAGAPDAWARLVPRPLRATEGRWSPLPGGGLHITEPRVRAVVLPDASVGARAAGPPDPDQPRVAELRFTYEGPTREQRPLQSGELRRQVGLKLRARDGCNVVYVMWRLAPDAKLVVSVKHNPGMRRSDDCGNSGYQTVKPRTHGPLPALEPGAHHTLRTELRGAGLKVWVDGEPCWEGALPAEALSFDGPVGLRTDNGRFSVELRSSP